MTGPSGNSIDVAALLSRVDIVDVIERYITLKKNGPEYEACCPFHSEDTPSFKVTPTKQFYHCFGCGANGDAIKFIQEHRGLSFVEACAELGGEGVSSAPVRPATPMAEKIEKVSPWVPVMPVPDGAGAVPVAHPVRGRPEAIYFYLDAEGRLNGVIHRYIKSDGGKELTSLSYCHHSVTKKFEWRWMSFPKPRPLYGLELLARYPTANVLLVEGEKCVDAGRVLLDCEVVVITWPGGGKAVDHSDWAPLAGRKVVCWPDADAKLYKGKKWGELEGTLMPAALQPGIATMEQIAQILLALDCSVQLVGLPDPGVKPDGWDIADAIAEGWDRQRVLDFIKADLHAPAEPVVDVPAGSALRKKKPVPKEPELLPRDEQPPAHLDEMPPLDNEIARAEPDWVRQLMRNDEGKVLAELQNVLLVLRNHSAWKGVIYLDDFSHRVMKKRAPPFPGGAVGEWTDVDDSMTHAWLTAEMRMLRLRTTMIAEAVQAVAALNAHNPLKEHLNGLKWDGEPRLNGWLIDYLGAGAFPGPKDKPEKIAADARTNQCVMMAGRMWLIAAVARVFNPGCKFDQVLILEGQQGLGKSSALGIIGGEWFMDTPIPLGDKEGLEMIQGVWIVEMAELDSFNKAESTTAKSFFSRSKDRFRLPYGHRTVMFSRSCIFAGTTNQSEYFSDKTGNRRYWPVMCRDYDRAALVGVRDQLLAEAVHRYKAGERFWPNREEEELFRGEQDQREKIDPWLEKIESWMGSLVKDWVTVSEILGDCLKIDYGRMDAHVMATRVGHALNKITAVDMDGKHYRWARKEDRSKTKCGARYFYEKVSVDE